MKFTNNLVSEHSVIGLDRGAARPGVRPPASGAQDPIRARQRRRGRPPGTDRPAQLLLRGPLRVRPEDPGGARLQDRWHHIVRACRQEREAYPAGHRSTCEPRSYGNCGVHQRIAR